MTYKADRQKQKTERAFFSLVSASYLLLIEDYSQGGLLAATKSANILQETEKHPRTFALDT